MKLSLKMTLWSMLAQLILSLGCPKKRSEKRLLVFSDPGAAEGNIEVFGMQWVYVDPSSK